MKVTRELYETQELLENSFAKKRIFALAQEDLLSSPEILERIEHGAELLKEWTEQEFYTVKANRVAHVSLLDLTQLSLDVITEIVLCCKQPMPLVSIASKCASKLRMADTVHAIQTMAEVISVLCDTDLFDVRKFSKDLDASYMVISKIQPDESVKAFMYTATYLPPMIHHPKKLRHNRSSGYITQQGESLILGGFHNHHEWDICLDVLNIMNRNHYELDEEFLDTVAEPKPEETIVDESVMYISAQQREAEKQAIENFEAYKEQCKTLYNFMRFNGNNVFFTHKVDKRGRVYSCGYHLSPQGNSYKKAMLNSKKKEVVSGVSAFLENCK